MRDLRRLAQFAKRLREKLPVAVNKVTMEVSESLFKDLVSITPIDTGLAISNWRIQIGSAPSGEIFSHDPGYRGSTRTTNIAIAVAYALQYLSVKKPGVAVYISNTAHHISSLNYGTSKQAPPGFIDAAVLRAQIKLRTMRLQL